MFNELIDWPIESDRLHWQARHVLRELHGEVQLLFRLTLTGTHFPERHELLVLHGERLLYSADGGETWEDWRAERLADLEITAVAAPQGFDDGAAVLVGLAGGQVRLV